MRRFALAMVRCLLYEFSYVFVDQPPELNDVPEDGSSLDTSELRERQGTLVEKTEALVTTVEPSVIAGGKTEGWTPVSAIVLWRRMMGILGNVNKVKDPEIHAKVFEHLIEIWNMLLTVFILSITTYYSVLKYNAIFMILKVPAVVQFCKAFDVWIFINRLKASFSV